MKRTIEPTPLEAIPDPTALTGNELAKSRDTRRRILEAATALIAEQGYHRFSTGGVARRANLTRPAMLYHFGSRFELVTAVIYHVTRRRIEMFTEEMLQLPLAPAYEGQNFRSTAADLSWAHLETPEFAAFTELVMAARTDVELATVVRPALAAFDRSRRETSERVFSEGPYNIDDMQLARDVTRFLTEGVAQQNSIIDRREERIAALRHFLRMLVATTAGNSFIEAVVADWKAQPARDISGPRG